MLDALGKSTCRDATDGKWDVWPYPSWMERIPVHGSSAAAAAHGSGSAAAAPGSGSGSAAAAPGSGSADAAHGSGSADAAHPTWWHSDDAPTDAELTAADKWWQEEGERMVKGKSRGKGTPAGELKLPELDAQPEEEHWPEWPEQDWGGDGDWGAGDWGAGGADWAAAGVYDDSDTDDQ